MLINLLLLLLFRAHSLVCGRVNVYVVWAGLQQLQLQWILLQRLQLRCRRLRLLGRHLILSGRLIIGDTYLIEKFD